MSSKCHLIKKQWKASMLLFFKEQEPHVSCRTQQNKSKKVMKNVNINSILVKTFTEYTSIFYSSLQDQLTVVFGSYFQTTFSKMSTNTNINKVLQKQGFIFVVANGKFRRGPRSILPKFAGAYFSGKKKKNYQQMFQVLC